MVISSISSSYRTYNICYVTRGPLLIGPSDMHTNVRIYIDIYVYWNYMSMSNVPAHFDGHGFLFRDSLQEYAKLQEGPLCPLLRASYEGKS